MFTKHEIQDTPLLVSSWNVTGYCQLSELMKLKMQDIECIAKPRQPVSLQS